MKRKSKYLLCFLFPLLLAGCGGIAPEDRAYPLALILDYDSVSQEYQMEYSMADLSEATGQGKEKEENHSDKKQEELSYRAKSLEEIEKQYRSSQEKFLDLGHIKAIFLGKGLLEREGKLEELLLYLQEQPMIGQNAAVFVCENSAELKKVSKELPESLGTYITEIYENFPSEKQRKPVTLGEVFYRHYNQNELPRLPLVSTDGEKIILKPQV